jgi:hypothetical protein
MSSPKPPPLPVSPTKSLTFICLNQLAIPGWGSFLAGRRLTGVIQIAGSLGGFALSLFWFGSFVLQWWRERLFPADGGEHLRLGVMGVCLFGAAWCWALATSLQIRQAARKTSA